MDQAICTNCRKFVDYNIREIDAIYKIKEGEYITYKKKLAFCKECGEQVWTAELDDYNAEAPWKTYWEKHGEI